MGVGIGGHPVAFDKVLPFNVFDDPILATINKEDAGSLALRLLSETGILGLLAFLAFFGRAIVRAAHVVRKQCLSGHKTAEQGVYLAIVGGASSLLAVYLVRQGVYYAPQLWVMFGMVLAIPRLAQNAVGKTP